MQRQLHVFAMDENYSTLQAQGSAYDLAPWFPQLPNFRHVGFLLGMEEIFLVEEQTGHTRIFSMATKQFRYARSTTQTLVPVLPLLHSPIRKDLLRFLSIPDRREFWQLLMGHAWL